MMDSFRNVSKEVTSFYPQEQPRARPISQQVLDKYLRDQHPCLEAVQKLMLRLVPYWNISLRLFKKNLYDMLAGQWQFQFLQENRPVLPQQPNLTVSVLQDIDNHQLYSKNISIYLGIWVPLTSMLLANILHNQPNQKPHFGVFGTGIIMTVSMLIISYAMYVYANLIESPSNIFLQHFCLTSYVNLTGFLYAVLCAATPGIVLVPMTIVYICVAIFLHFRIYNQIFKPTLFVMIALFLLLSVFYIGTGFTFYSNFLPDSQQIQTKAQEKTPAHEILLRHFENFNR